MRAGERVDKGFYIQAAGFGMMRDVWDDAEVLSICTAAGTW